MEKASVKELSDFSNSAKHEKRDKNLKHRSSNTGEYNKNYTKPNKYCTFNKSRSHSNEECRANKTTSPSNNRSYALREPINIPKTIEIPLNIKETEFKSMIDTSSTENIIPQNIAESENLIQIPLEKKKIVEVANGSTVEINHFCDLKFQIMNDKNITYKSRFLVLPTKSDVIIL
ncbi:hypothetical protein DMUE_5608 [Dictyocoela muelleri]|nr:hypothetical protein DMUE_5608 [Dictyocoela muelleri]